MNPNSYDTFCVIVPYPESCVEEKWYDWNFCTWDEGSLEGYFRYVNVAVIVVALQFSLIVVGMSIILWTIFKNNGEIKSLVMQSSTGQACFSSPSTSYCNVEEQINEIQSADNNLRDLKYTRVLIFQALMYIGAYMLTWILNLLSASFNIAGFELDAVNSVLFPLQGFWNLMIFLYDKTYLVRKRDKSDTYISFWMAIKRILASPSDTPAFVVSNLSNVHIELREENVPEELNEVSLSSPSLDVGLSQIPSEYDGLSDLRKGEDFSVLQDSNGIVNSDNVSTNSVGAVSDIGKVSSLEDRPRTNLINVRKSFLNLKKGRGFDR